MKTKQKTSKFILLVSTLSIIATFVFTLVLYTRLVGNFLLNQKPAAFTTTTTTTTWPSTIINVVDPAIVSFLLSLKPPGKFYPIIYETVTDRTTKKTQLHCGTYQLFKDTAANGGHWKSKKIADVYLDLYSVVPRRVPTLDTAWRFDFHVKGQFYRNSALIESSNFQLDSDNNSLTVRYNVDGVEKRTQISFPTAHTAIANKLYLPCLARGPSADFYFLIPRDPALLKHVNHLVSLDVSMTESGGVSGVGRFNDYAPNRYGHCRRGVYTAEKCQDDAYYVGTGKCFQPDQDSLEAKCLQRQMEVTSKVALKNVKIYLGDVVDDRLYFECLPVAPYVNRKQCKHVYERFDYDTSNKCVIRNPCFDQSTPLPRVGQIDVQMSERLRVLYPNSYVTCFNGGANYVVRNCDQFYPGGTLATFPPFNYCVDFACSTVVDPVTGKVGQGWRLETSQFEPNSNNGIVGGLSRNKLAGHRFAETAVTIKLTCVDGRVFKRESARIVERLENVLPQTTGGDQAVFHFYVRYWMPEFIFDETTGKKIVCLSFRDAPQLFRRTGKLRVYSALTSETGLMSFVRLSMFVDVATNVKVFNQLTLETRTSMAVPTIVSSDELDVVRKRLDAFGGFPKAQLFACSWIDKTMLFQCHTTPGAGSFEEGVHFKHVVDSNLASGYAYYTNAWSNGARIEANVFSSSVAVLRTNENNSFYVHAVQTYYTNLIRTAGHDTSNILGYIFSHTIVPPTKPTADDANVLIGNCALSATSGLESALKYLKNVYIYEPSKRIWCLNGVERPLHELPCTAKMGLLPTANLTLNTCTSLEIVRPAWILTSNVPDNVTITYKQYLEPNFVANTVSNNDAYVLKSGNVVSHTSTVLTLDEYRRELKL
ncbi:Hypothetical predicted protein [Olea europaea subsp. europaea]|uniref:Uncharacterized protein n=1 Tax=Olea europaea subsp. europaea TaxID=158383 RepID=A0A8S0TG60_OLEEU|nr:Hypothetical predicted protein [Olea europaea subsp. europaea]